MKDSFNRLRKSFRSNRIPTRIISFFLCMVLVFLVIPTVVYAEAIDGIKNTNNSSDIQENEQDFSYLSANYEIPELREENVKHFRTDDGKYIAAQYNYPVHYLDEDGSWQDIDNALYTSGSEYMTSDTRIKFAKKITGNETLFTLHNGDKKITLSLENAIKGVTGSVTNGEDAKEDTELQKMMNLEKLSSSVYYENILDGVDVEYIATSNNIKENIIVKEKKDNYSYTFTLKLNNLTAELDGLGNVQILDSDGKATYVIPAPVVWDNGGVHAPSSVAAYALTPSNGGRYTLNISVDSAWMNAEERVFPVTVDPAVKLSPSTIVDTYVDSAHPGNSYSSEIYFSVSETKRAYWKMGYTPTIPSNSYITGAYLSLYWINGINPVYVHQATSTWDSTLTYNQTLGSVGHYNPAPMDYQEFESEGRYEWEITSAVKDWYSSSSLNHGVVLTGSGTTDAMFFSNDDSYDKPVITIEYIDMKGLEDYNTYSSHNIGAAGSGNVNLATGQLSLVIPTLTTTDGLFGFTASLVRNSEMTGRYYGSSYSQTPYISYMPIGYKWNFTETIIKKSLTDGNGDSFTVYVLSDSDGTEHVFHESEDSPDVYYDEDGLLLTLIPNSSGLTVTVTSIDDTVKTYTSNAATLGYWYLKSVTDKNGNSLNFTLDSNYRVTNIGITPYGQSLIPILKLVYGSSSDSAPRLIYNVSSKDAVVFRYSNIYNGTILSNATTYLRSVTFVHGSSNTTETNLTDFYSNASNTTNLTVDATMSYEYDSSGKIISVTDGLSAYKVAYTYSSNGKVTAVTETAGTTTGQTAKFNYYNGYTESISSGTDEAIDTSDDIYTRYVFDNRGRVISSYSTDKTKTIIYGATSGVYETQDNAKNNIKQSAAISGSSSNYIINGDFEQYSGNVPQYWTLTNATLTGQISGLGQNRARLNVSSGVTSQIAQRVFLPAGTYTLSADIYTFFSNGVAISLNADGNTDYTKEVPVVEYDNSNTARISLTFTAASVTNGGEYFNISVKAIGSAAVNASAYITVDDVMLEEGMGSTGYELVEVGNFENNAVSSSNAALTSIGSFWTPASVAYAEYVTTDSLFGKSARVTPDSEIKQRIYTAPNTQTILRSSFTVSGFGKSAEAMVSDKAKFGIRVDVVYYGVSGNDVTVPYYFSFTAGCRDWQFLSGSFKVDNENYIHYIDVVCEYSNQVSGYGYFDNISVKSDDGQIKSLTYYENGLTRSSETVFYTEYYEYDSNLNLTRTANNRGEITDRYYNENGNITRKVYREFTWNHTKEYPINLAQSQRDAEIVKTTKVQTTYGYDVYGSNTSTLTIETDVLSTGDIVPKANTKPIETKRTYATSAGSKIFGVMTSETNEMAVTTYYYYNSSNGRLLATVNSSTGNGVCYIYDGIGNLTKVRPADYESASQYSAITDAESVTYTYNSKNQLATVYTEGTHYTLTSDSFGNVTSVKAGSNTLATYTYYPNNGKLKKVSYSNGFSEEYVYDTLENLSEIWYNYSNGSRVKAYTYLYTSSGQLYRFDDLIRQKSTVYDYTTGGNITSIIEYSLSDDYTDLEESLGYNDDGQLASHYYKLTTGTERTTKSLQHTYQYNSDGSVKSAALYTKMTRGNESFTYDNFGRVTKYVNDHYLESNSSTKFNNTVSYGYYSTSSGYTTSLVSSYTTQVNSATATAFSYVYDAAGNITRIYNSTTGQNIYYHYDDLNQLIREDNQPKGYTYVYAYDTSGNITKKTSYAYTTVSSITSSPRSTTNMSYSTSAWGDMLTSYGNNTITYDAIGNPIVYKTGGNFTFAWEGRRLISATKAQGTISFTYNDEGIRTSKTNTSGVTTYYSLSGNRILSETKGDEVFIYIYDTAGAPMGMQYRNSSYADGDYDVFWYEKNLQGDIIAVYDEAGTLLITYKYTAWGDATSLQHNGGYSTAAYHNPFMYRGYYYDTDLYLYYLNSRYYDPITGRFISPDTPEVISATPMALTDKNLYAYCDNNPVMRRDDGGEFWNWLVGGVVGAIGGAILASAQGKQGNDFWASVAGGAVSGVITGLAADAIIIVGGTGIVIGAVSGGLGNVAGTLVKNSISGETTNTKQILVDTAFGVVMGATFSALSGPQRSMMEEVKSIAGKKALQRGISVGYAIKRTMKRELSKMGSTLVEESLTGFTSWFVQAYVESWFD